MIRLIHTSDLHLGRHDPAVLNDLVLLVHRLRSQDRVSRLLMTGDATNTGSVGQFDHAREILGNHAALAGPAAAGLVTTQPGTGVVPGNHDYGPRRLVFSEVQTDHFVEFFGQLPAPGDPFSIGEGWGLQVLRVCTTRGAGRRDQFLARGSCVDQLASLRQRLGDDGDKPHGVVRVLLLHHPPSYRYPWAVPWPPFELDVESRDELARLVEDCEIDVLLSGHTHVPFLRVGPMGGRQVVEAVSGSSAIRSGTKAAEVLGHAVKGAPGAPNSLVVHEIQPAPDTLTWTSKVYERLNARFAPYDGGDESKLPVSRVIDKL